MDRDHGYRGYILAALIAALLLVFAVQAQAETIHVNPAWAEGDALIPEPFRYGIDAFPSVTEAVRAAQPGDDIVLEAGLYNEPVEQFPIEIDRMLTIRAEGDAVIEGPAFKAVFEIAVPGVTMQGLDIRFRHWGMLVLSDNVVLLDNRLTLLEEKYRISSCGVWLAGAYNATLKGNVFTGCGLCIAGPPLSESSKGIPVLTGLFEVGEDPALFTSHCMEDNLVNGKPLYYAVNQTGVAVPDDAGQVIVACCKDIELLGLTVSDTSIGATIVYSENISITDVRADRCGIFGIYLAYIKGGTIQGAVSNHANHGIDIRCAQGILLRECTTKACEQGIFLSWAQGCLLVDCEMKDGGRGLFLANGMNNQVEACIVDGNENGICTEGEKGLMLVNNIVTGSTVAGIRLLRGDVICLQNNISDNWTGMIISDTSPLTLSGNLFVDNESCAVYLREVFQGKIILNHFAGNTETYIQMDTEIKDALITLNTFLVHN